MEIRWAKLAARDLERIHRYIAKRNPIAAGNVIQTLYDGCSARRPLIFLPILSFVMPGLDPGIHVDRPVPMLLS